MLITQQPGSIPVEILSQGDNWFIFHLLSAADLGTLHKANAHFSEDLLSTLLNEPIPGQGVFWSSAGGKPYPISVRVLSFETMYQCYDPNFQEGAVETYATHLRQEFDAELETTPVVYEQAQSEEVNVRDPLETFEQRAILALRREENIMRKLRGEGVAWGLLKKFLLGYLPESLEDRDDIAYHLVRKFLTQVFGEQGVAWSTYKHPERNNTAYVRVHDGQQGTEEP